MWKIPGLWQGHQGNYAHVRAIGRKMGTREIEVNMPDGTTLIQLAERFELEGMLDSGMRVAIDGIVESNTSGNP